MMFNTSDVSEPEHPDSAAIADLYVQYQHQLRGYLTRLIGDYTTAEDLCHECFSKAIRAWHQRNPECNRVAWLFQIATNTAYDELRRRRRRPTVTLTDRAEIADERLATDVWVSEAAAVRATLLRLPEHERVPLTLQVYADHSLAEIAAATNASVGAVKTRLRRARAHFRALYHE